MTHTTLLALAGALSFSLALLHIVMIFVGAEAYRYFAAGKEMVEAAEAGSFKPTIVTLGVTAFFALFGVYALSGAGFLMPLPILQPSLWVIGGIYSARGLAVIVQIVMLSQGKTGANLEAKDLVFSLVSLCIGLVYLVGAWQRQSVSNAI
jgi:putative oxidoreductase